MLCADVKCPSECKIIGYNNVKTFDGETFNFDVPGTLCHYTFVQVKVKLKQKTAKKLKVCPLKLKLHVFALMGKH